MATLSHETVAAGVREAIRLRNGEMPTLTELESAPLLSGWVLEEAENGLWRFGGLVTGHPVLRPGWCWTSVVLYIEPNRGWARTVSRIYRLGEPLNFDSGQDAP